MFNKETGKWMGRKDVIIYAARPSHSCRTLATALSARRWYETSGNGPRIGKKLLVNWGSILSPVWQGNLKQDFRWINHPDRVGNAIDKIKFFSTLEAKGFTDAVGYTLDSAQARLWQSAGRSLLERQVLNGHSGRGIIVRAPSDPVQAAPLYTRYYAKTHEYRVHVFQGKVLFISEKRRRTADPGSVADNIIRVGGRGWVYSNRLSISSAGAEQLGVGAARCAEALQLDFGAVDILCKLAEGEDGARRLRGFKVCEINTAPGLENTTTIEAYKNAILGAVKNG